RSRWIYFSRWGRWVNGGEENESMADNAKDAFAAMFRKAVMDYRFGVEGPLTKPITYVAAENGLFEIRMNAIGTFARKIDGIEGLGLVAAGYTPALPKVPWEFFEKIVSFFRAVMQRHGGAEAYIQIFWNREEGKYFAHVPKQCVSGGHVSFDRDVELEATHTLVLEAHSHNSMGAFWSGTDDHDEQGDRLFMVIGRLDCRIPQVKVRYGMAGHHEDLTIEEVFEAPVEGEANQTWMEQVKPPKPEREELPPWWQRTNMAAAMLCGMSNGDAQQEVLFNESGLTVHEGDQGPRPGPSNDADHAEHAGAAGSPGPEDPDRGVRGDGGLGGATRGPDGQVAGSGVARHSGRRSG
ncbi:MAG TPA: hypothetical protein VLM91_24570, partial [Candidatus Methylomirabilis sp.]|nr:hypothetical protein [Candidatus Methylomirabilis sp.]